MLILLAAREIHRASVSSELRSFTSSIKFPSTAEIVSSSNKDPVPFVGIRTLVILIGNLRCGEVAWRSLYENVIDFNTHVNSTVDLALVIGEEVNEHYKNATLFDKAKYTFQFTEHDDWGVALDQIDSSWRERVAPLLHNSSILLGGAKYDNWKGSGAISFWIRWFISQKIEEYDWLQKYDRFIITRTDHFYLCPMDLSGMDNQYLWVPEGEDYSGITDRHLIVSSEKVMDALNILPGFFADPSPEFYEGLNHELYNPETMIWQRWIKLGLAPEVFQGFSDT